MILFFCWLIMLVILIFFIIFILFLYGLIFTKINYNNLFKWITLLGGIFVILNCFLIILFDKSTAQPQMLLSTTQILNWSYGQTLLLFGVDGLSLFFVVLTSLLTFLCILDGWNNKTASLVKYKEFILYFLLLELFLIISFTTLDLLVFYVFFESVLIPMFLIIGIWGSRERKIRADFYFFLYTLMGSVLMFFCILILFFETYNTNYFVLYNIFFNVEKEFLLWVFSFIAFSVKIPMFPFHIWLPEAHVEASTGGSVLLAGLLLKLGGYGLIRIVLPLFPYASYYFFPLISICCLLGIFYASLTTIRQIDLKRIIAYSSVAHMNIVLLGIFSCNVNGLQGAIFLMIAHGIVSGALFFIIGNLYKRHGTRLLYYYGGLVTKMPIFSIYLFIFCLANIGTPGTCNFIGELIVFISLIDKNFFITLLSSLSVILSVIYTIWFLNRLLFGNTKIIYIQNFADLNSKENFTLFILFVLTIFLGLFPNFILDFSHVTSAYIVELMSFRLNLI